MRPVRQTYSLYTPWDSDLRGFVGTRKHELVDMPLQRLRSRFRMSVIGLERRGPPPSRQRSASKVQPASGRAGAPRMDQGLPQIMPSCLSRQEEPRGA